MTASKAIGRLSSKTLAMRMPESSELYYYAPRSLRETGPLKMLPSEHQHSVFYAAVDACKIQHLIIWYML